MGPPPSSPIPHRSWSTRGRAALLFLLVLGLRVWIAARFSGNFDSQAFRVVAELVLAGRNVYAGTDLYNYSPLWSRVVAVLWKLSRRDFPSFVFVLGLLQTASDAGSAVLVGRIARRLGRTDDEARAAALLFFSNPISVAASSAHGQFDGLAILPLLGAILLALGDAAGRRPRGVAALLGLSLLVKHVTLFQPFLFWRRVRPGGIGTAALAAPFLALGASFLPFASAWRRIWQNVVLYGTRGAQPGALRTLLDVPAGWSWLFTFGLAGAAAWAIVEGRNLELPRASLLLALATLVFLPGWGLQYLVWPLAVGCLYPSVGLGLYALAGGLHYSASGLSLGLRWPVHAPDRAAWAAAAVWLAMEASRARTQRRADPASAGPRRPGPPRFDPLPHIL